MTRRIVLVLVVAFILSACIPSLPFSQQPAEAPVIDALATDESLAESSAVETLNALPTPTLEPATITLEPTVTYTQTVTATTTETATATETLTPDPNATATATGTLETLTATITGTPPTETVTSTGTLATSTATQSATPSATQTLYARFYGTLPPALPSGRVKLVNKSKAEVYISMHCTTVDGYTTILEYPVVGTMRVSAPAGSYSYVAWVGGKKFQGWFKLSISGDATITFEKNKVTTK